jgi:integrase
VRLEPGTTKNDDGREFPFHALPPLAALLTRQRERTAAVEKATQQIVRAVFHRRDGERIKDFRGAWESACTQAGLAGRLVHDLRRCAVRRLEDAGVSRSTATKLTGHRTESTFTRYAIRDKADLSVGVAKVAAYVHQVEQRADSPTVIPVTGKVRAKLAV